MAPSQKSALFTPLTIRGVTFKNRIGVAPMGMCSAVDGFANDYHLVNYGSFATGGPGLVIVEATAVEERGRVTTSDLGLWKEEHVEQLAVISKFIKNQGSVPGIQLAHSGRKGSAYAPFQGRGAIEDKDGGWQTIAPSAIPFGGDHNKLPKEATIDDLKKIKQAFVTAAKRAVTAGFELIELHFAHGFFVNNFLTAVSNQRRGKYGGNLENRMRLPLEIAQEVREAIPETVLAVRLSVTDYIDGGWNIDHSVELAKKLKALGVDIVDCSSGGVADKNNMKVEEVGAIQRSAAKRVQQEAGIPTFAVGQIIDPLLAENIVKNNEGTIVLLGRMFLNNPRWTYHAADVLDSERSFKYPKQYDWCIGWQAFGRWRKFLYTNVEN